MRSGVCGCEAKALANVPGLRISPALLWSHLVVMTLRSATARSSIAYKPLDNMVAKWVDLAADDPTIEQDRVFAVETPARMRGRFY